MSGRPATRLGAGAIALVTLTVGLMHAPVAMASTTETCDPPQPPPLPPPQHFVSQVTNPYFPLVPGTTYFYFGNEGTDRVVDTVTVTHGTKVILGVTATVVVDVVVVNGQPSERTQDWYAQDDQGNVWYLGEAAFDFEHGHWVLADDSWQAGKDGAQAGYIMEAKPQVGDAYTQEDFVGHAQDMAQVLSTDAVVHVPYGTFHDALFSKECTPLEPGVVDIKYYALGYGEVSEATARGGSAQLQLVDVKTGG
jgi:hypothetical protein